VKNPGWFEDDDGRPKSVEGDKEERVLLELPKEELAGGALPPVPTFVIRGKAGADIDEPLSCELPKLPKLLPREGEGDAPARVPADPGEVVFWALSTARRGPSESV
jgi:hypothetical protein